MNFYDIAGQMALGSRLRRLGDVFLADAEKIYRLYDVDIDPRWFPVFYMLTVKDSAGITELAEDIGQTHPAVSQVVKAMAENGIVEVGKDPADARVSRIALTGKGRNVARKMASQCEDVHRAVGDIMRSAGSNLWSDLGAIERELEVSNLQDRVRQIRRAREQKSIEIVPFDLRFETAFRELNIAWIQKHWKLEAADYQALDNPSENIIARGGYIAVALRQSEPVGVCALIKMEGGGYELAKMAVDESVRGAGIGYLLGEHVIAVARERRAERLYLESNTLLKPAINLYRKLGFRTVQGQDSPYDRCNIQMELVL